MDRSEDGGGSRSLRTRTRSAKDQDKDVETPLPISKRSSRLRDPEFAAKHKAFLQKVATATNGSMDSYLKQESSGAAAAEVVAPPDAAAVSSKPAQGEAETSESGAVKRKLPVSSSPSLPSSQAPDAKRRRSNRTSSSGNQVLYTLTSPSSLSESGNGHFTPQQTDLLKRLYAKNVYPSPEQKVEVEKAADLTRKSVNKWFERQRMKASRDLKKKSSPIVQPILHIDQRLLNSVFQSDRWPDKDWMIKMAQFTGISCSQVILWFKERRKLARPFSDCNEMEKDDNDNYLNKG